MTRAPAAPGQLVLRFDGGPWDSLLWTPANPAGVLAVLRVHGWAGSYRRHRIDHTGRWVYTWAPDGYPGHHPNAPSDPVT